jgi:hypothetical protein
MHLVFSILSLCVILVLAVTMSVSGFGVLTDTALCVYVSVLLICVGKSPLYVASSGILGCTSCHVVEQTI